MARETETVSTLAKIARAGMEAGEEVCLRFSSNESWIAVKEFDVRGSYNDVIKVTEATGPEWFFRSLDLVGVRFNTGSGR